MSPCSVSSRRIVMVAFPGANAVDVIGPLEVFSVAAALRPHEAGEAPAYTTEGVATTAGAGRPPARGGPGASPSPRAPRRPGGTPLLARPAGGGPPPPRPPPPPGPPPPRPPP